MRNRTISLTMTLATLVTGLMTSMAPAALAEVGYPPAPQPTVVSQTLPPAAPPVRASSAVAFTGSNVLRWAVFALILFAIGSLLVIGARRRRGATGKA